MAFGSYLACLTSSTMLHNGASNYEHPMPGRPNYGDKADKADMQDDLEKRADVYVYQATSILASLEEHMTARQKTG